jgi:hypothetical protein
MLTRAATLRYAADLVGFDTLTHRLHVSRGALACWMLLDGVPPMGAFLQAADIVFEQRLAALEARASNPS